MDLGVSRLGAGVAAMEVAGAVELGAVKPNENPELGAAVVGAAAAVVVVVVAGALAAGAEVEVG